MEVMGFAARVRFADLDWAASAARLLARSAATVRVRGLREPRGKFGDAIAIADKPRCPLKFLLRLAVRNFQSRADPGGFHEGREEPHQPPAQGQRRRRRDFPRQFPHDVGEPRRMVVDDVVDAAGAALAQSGNRRGGGVLNMNPGNLSTVSFWQRVMSSIPAPGP